MAIDTKHLASGSSGNMTLLIIALLFALSGFQAIAQNNAGNASNVTRIFDIQYTTSPGGASPYDGQTVTTRGVVTATSYYGFTIAEEEGPWHAVFVYTQNYGPKIGYRVQLTGTVDEYYGLTELVGITDYQLLSVHHPDHIKSVPVLAQDVRQEAYEAVLVSIENVTVSGFTYYGEWTISDGSGSVDCAYMNDYNYFPQQGDMLDAVTGFIYYIYGDYYLMPRCTNDMSGPPIRHFALRGTVVTMNEKREILPDAYVEILGDKIIRISKAKPAHCDIIVPVEGYIFPGLIDAHNHPFWNVFGHIPFGTTFDERYDWQVSQLYQDFGDQFDNLMVYDPPWMPFQLGQWINVNKVGELRALCAGTTTWQGVNCNYSGDEEYALQGIGINNAERHPARIWSEVFPLSQSSINSWPYRLNQYWERFAIHLCEGINQDALDEFYAAKSLGLLNDRLSIIHGVPLTSTEFVQMAAAKAHLIWSPKTNVYLYGQTANIPAALAEGVNVALAPDWTESGEFDLLDELRYAKAWSGSNWSNCITDRQFAEFVTVNAAYALGLQDRIGSLVPGKQADIVVFPKCSTDPYADLLDTYPRDVLLTIVSGRPMYGNPSLMGAFPFLTNTESISICSAQKTVAWQVDSKYAWFSMDPVSLIWSTLVDAYNAATPVTGTPMLHYDKCTPAPKRNGRAAEVLPQTLELHQNYPNPFNPSTTIEYSIPVDGEVSVVVYDALGRQVETLCREWQQAGSYTLHFDGRNLPSGTYRCSMTTAGTTLTRPMTLAK